MNPAFQTMARDPRPHLAPLLLSLHIVCLVVDLEVVSQRTVLQDKFTLKNSPTGNEISTTSTRVRSKLECAAACDRHSGCTRFCYSRWTGECYLKDCVVTPLVMLNETGEDLNSSDIVCSGLCPEHLGYHEVLGECVKVYGGPLTYLDARNTCEQEGAHLYHFKNRERDSVISQTAAFGSGVLDDRLWVGADDLEEEATILWSDGCLLANDDVLWYAPDNEPTNSPDHNENCIELYANVMYLNDVTCDMTRRFICQMY